ncbi:nucleoside monophosphate kinase [Coxiella endosymbiont of Amblyomma americanum]|uniref:nucleoside monophosphate kinase n=1 Tax=Coxiella endosymbiont of Amblyomma americanum TaxID=325775 RepID=UPI000581D08C|nr:nucleoside monophosphate kinase [Coxiella endosymbiont of Amblyomma americanum]AJC50495.1 adenylate kinase [Coxiella endosymbiont of Amblyomma americanum]AUJ58832.1 nucleoside monophosphate kinase [Coxiella-like endosymbiont of Amblyomma americanum]
MRIVLLGPPGAGKGTQSNLISSQLNIPRISIGDILRVAIRNKTPFEFAIKKAMKEGRLVANEIIMTLIKEFIHSLTHKKGYILDGFPRTVKQAKALRIQKIYVDLVININIPEKEVIERTTGRLVHLASGRIYHQKYNPPEILHKDNLTGELLIRRIDDSEEVIRKRLLIYKKQIDILIQYFLKWEKSGDCLAPSYYCVSGLGTASEVKERILKILETQTNKRNKNTFSNAK